MSEEQSHRKKKEITAIHQSKICFSAINKWVDRSVGHTNSCYFAWLVCFTVKITYHTNRMESATVLFFTHRTVRSMRVRQVMLRACAWCMCVCFSCCFFPSFHFNFRWMAYIARQVHKQKVYRTIEISDYNRYSFFSLSRTAVGAERIAQKENERKKKCPRNGNVVWATSVWHETVSVLAYNAMFCEYILCLMYSFFLSLSRLLSFTSNIQQSQCGNSLIA